MGKAALFLSGLLVTASLSFRFSQQNHPPDVQLMTPAPGGIVDWNSPIRYSITVSDKEDGESKFDEINQREVLLEVALTRDTGSLKSPKADRAALYAMLASNCMNCHAFNSKLIGPSFEDIGSRYSDRADLPALIKHVREGSKGVWADITMPSHPELSPEQIADMVHWILRYRSDAGISYYTGTEGSFRLTPPPSDGQWPWISVTAGYMDHQHAVGEHHIFLKAAPHG